MKPLKKSERDNVNIKRTKKQIELERLFIEFYYIELERLFKEKNISLKKGRKKNTYYIVKSDVLIIFEIEPTGFILSARKQTKESIKIFCKSMKELNVRQIPIKVNPNQNYVFEQLMEFQKCIFQATINTI